MTRIASEERSDSPSPAQARVFDSLLKAVALWNPLSPDFFQHGDWKSLIASADHHGVLPVLAERVLTSSLTIESGVREYLRKSLSATTMRNLRLAQEVVRVSSFLRQNGVEVIPYKGPALAHELWGSISLRECSDLDFLVRATDVERAGELLQQLEYVRVAAIPKHLRPALLRNASEENFRRRDGQVHIELQWAPAPAVFAINFDESSLWRRAREIPFVESSVFSPQPEDLLRLLCVHGWKHNWSRLIWLGDVAQVLNRFRIDWGQVAADAQAARQNGVVALALYLSNRCFQTELPCTFSANAKIRRLGDLLLQAMREDRTASYLQWHRYMLWARDTHSDQVRQLIRFLLTPGLGEYRAFDLPPWASSAYRLIRLGRVLQMLPGKAHEQ